MSSIETIVRRIKEGKSTAASEVSLAIEKCESASSYEAVLMITRERALERAHEIDQKIASGENAGRLAGVPFIAKDNFMTHGGPSTAASKMLEDFVSPVQAEAIERLEAEGAICIGKSNLDAFAHGGSTENSAFKITRNAVDTSRVPGGSSGGSAVVVALDVVPFALGTDTGGSIRQPASFNGVVGMKPTYGTVSRYGVVAMSSSTDTVGVFARKARDAEIVIDIMSGKDASDMTTLEDFFAPIEMPRAGQKIAIIKELMDEDTDSEVQRVTLDYAEKLRSLGHMVDEVSLPMAKQALAMYYIIVPAEISSNLARYDGIRYGYRADDAKSLVELYGKTRGEGFETENKRRIMIGSFVLSSGYFDAYYKKAQKARTLLISEFDKLFDKYDILIGPVAPTPAFGLGENTSDPVKMYLADLMTVPASLAGLPAISVPAGESSDGLPIGVQLIGARKTDANLLALARSLEDS